ncbi:MAG: Signal peptidase I [Parcubacteria group bacterium GW2011_GWF2_38_76]|nr:MAG: Signal peptidase I [Parcubacteria group bacterium GW2011_GWF2_38_76]HBM45611.1 signal peptidase I [Patescibacteria group bacterium]
MILENNAEKEVVSCNEPCSTPEVTPPIVCVEKQESWWDFIKEIVRFTILSLIIVLPVRFFIAQPFLVSGGSMDPTFADGQYLIIDELSYYFNNPQRNEVIVFRYPNNPSKYFIKRIIGLPGETIIIKNNEVTIKNKDNPTGLKLNEIYVKNQDFQERSIEMKLSGEQYFVMGDNRAASSDSRDWGPLDKKLITGHVFVRLLPFNKVSLYPEKVTE